MKISQYIIVLVLFSILPAISSAATTDFTASSDITVADVTFGLSTVSMTVFSGSVSESFSFDSGAFTVLNPGSIFQIGSSDSSVKSVQISRGGSVVACAENSTPGTSYVSLPTSSGTYTVSPSTTTDCTDLCTILDNTASYNSFPTCGAASCNSGYKVSGSGASATCVQIGGGGIFTGSSESLPGYVEPRQQTIYPDGTVVYLDEEEVVQDAEEIEVKTFISNITSLFTENTPKEVQSNQVKEEKEISTTDSSISPNSQPSEDFDPLPEEEVEGLQTEKGNLTIFNRLFNIFENLISYFLVLFQK